VRQTLDVVAATAPALEAYREMLVLLERAQFQSPALSALQGRVAFGSVPPSAHLARLTFWVGLAELRHNFLFHVVINNLALWDLHVLNGIERFVQDVGRRASEWFAALGELEALAALATLAHGDPDASMPVLADEHAALTAVRVGHPLLAPSARIPNDVTLRGPGSALVVTGSNMAGKSTLLRAVGQNIALALAGGPVIAQHMIVPRVRLRASMRADDSLESGSSYFHAELAKLKRVIDDAAASPAVFFLLDELLRGTNARARHVGAKAVLVHLLDRRGTGLCATHDVELAALEQTDPMRIENVHFTDVIIEGEMRFDYKLRPGIVRTSNALRLLAMAGVDVPQNERDTLEGVSGRGAQLDSGKADQLP
jgi:DNA mismatch repair ATPase MutS